MASRRSFFRQSSGLAIGALGGRPAQAADAVLEGSATQERSLCGLWLFRTDPEDAGERQNWYGTEAAAADWRPVNVPHTWQIEAPLADYRGRAWYRRTFDALPLAQSSTVRVEFEAVFHSAKVWVNGQPAGEHARKGYTAFAFNITHLLHADRPNVIAVRVDNAFNEDMLPRGRSSDWAHDGGIFRPVQLLITPKVYLERVHVDTFPDFSTGDARLEIAAFGRNTGTQLWKGALLLRVVDEETGLAVLTKADAAELTVAAGSTGTAKISVTLPQAKLWHFDHPHLYDLELAMTDGRTTAHRLVSTFGVRRFEVKDDGFLLNGERVWLMGVERMAGSNPEFGMAEPDNWIDHDHADLKNLNCVFTRVHWPQDRRVLDYCDRHGILIQTEVPTWGPQTFAGMGNEPSEVILQNGMEQLREMVARDRNHPCICSWGVCNEINGQNPPAYAFAKRMYEEAKKLDPNRLVSYASNSLFQTPGKDVAGLMDFVMMNEYYGSWQHGTPADLARNLDEIHEAFPNKPIVISEYGYCACTADRPEGDQKRVETLVEQDRVFRERDYVSGLIFFCYNDYRTHIGDRGMGVMKQRVHGVVDLYGARKASYEVLRTESSPVESIAVDGAPKDFKLTVRTRRHVPAHTLRGYKLRGIYYGYGDIPVERKEVELPELAAGQEATLSMAFAEAMPLRIQFDVLRPTGFSAYSREWKP
jgi:beta-glucuronidase